MSLRSIRYTVPFADAKLGVWVCVLYQPFCDGDLSLIDVVQPCQTIQFLEKNSAVQGHVSVEGKQDFWGFCFWLCSVEWFELFPVNESALVDNNSKHIGTKAIEKVLAGAIRRELALEELYTKQHTESMQPNRVVSTYGVNFHTSKAKRKSARHTFKSEKESLEFIFSYQKVLSQILDE